MTTLPPENKHDAIPFTDFLRLLKKGKATILLSLLIGALAFGLFGLTRPVHYQAQATFRDKGNSRDALPSSNLYSLINAGISGNPKSDAKTLMQSRKLLERTAKLLGIQSTLTQKTKESRLLKTIGENLRVEYTYLKKAQIHPLPDPHLPIKIVDLSYSDEIPLNLELAFDNEGEFAVIETGTKTEIGVGKAGIPFQTETYAFTVESNGTLPTDVSFSLTLHPIADVVEALKVNLEITPDKEDNSLLTLSFNHRDRHLAAQFLNTLMQTYQDHQISEQERISSSQIAYLNRREGELGDKLKSVLENYASQLSIEPSDIGYVDSEKGMEFLSNELQTLRKKEMTSILDLHRLQKIDSEHHYYYPAENSTILNDFLSRIRALDMQTDSIEMTLRHASSKDPADWQTTFNEQIQELNGLRRCSEDANVILSSLENEKYPLPHVALLDKKEYMVGTWNQELKSNLEALQSANPLEADLRKEELNLLRMQFIGYLNNLRHFLDVNVNMIRERLEHQQTPQFEFQGIDMKTANELYVEYSKLLSETEIQILQLRYFTDQLQNNSEFEMSSLSSVLGKDPIAQNLIQKAGEYALAIQDDSNRGPKEKERLKRDLETLKRFLGLHLAQTIELKKLHEEQVRRKIQSLQYASLGLAQQQRSILEKQYVEAVDTQIERLKQERLLITEQVDGIHKELAKLPDRWASEKLVEHQIHTNAKMVEELTKLVESKNISFNLEIIQASPLDSALPPVKPARPLIILYSILGAFLGLFAGCALVLFNALLNGMPASRERLAMLHVKIAESPLTAASHLLKHQIKHSLVIGPHALSYSQELAQTFGQNTRILLLQLDCEPEIAVSAIQTSDGYDYLTCGGLNDADGLQMIASIKEQTTQYEADYDHVIITAELDPLSPKGKLLLDEWETVFVLIGDESVAQLEPLLKKSEKQDIFFIV
jgi:tyrosine-protein kinase Etk/Wzc